MFMESFICASIYVGFINLCKGVSKLSEYGLVDMILCVVSK